MNDARCLVVIALGLLLTLAGCARPPHQKLDSASHLVDRARAVQAQQHAPTEFQAALDALQDARSSIQNRDYKKADNSLDFSLQHASRAIILAEETVARLAIQAEQAQRQQEQAARQAAEAARQAEQKAAELAAKAAAQKSAQQTARKPAPSAEPANTYQVLDGENLWIISAKSVVYDDGFLWPLIYQANRDQIKDPRQIYPGQVLNIRRDLTEQEKIEARQKARESDIFPLPQP